MVSSAPTHEIQYNIPRSPGIQSTNRSPVPPDHKRVPIILALRFSTLETAIIVVLLRFHKRLKLRAHGWDAYTIYFALVINPPASDDKQCCLIIHRLFVSSVAPRIPSRCVWDSEDTNIYVKSTPLEASKWTTMAEIQATVATGLTVCLFILRIIKVTHRKQSKIVSSFIVINILGTLAFVFVISFQCYSIQQSMEANHAGARHLTNHSSGCKQTSRR